MRKYLLFVLILLSGSILQAQTVTLDTLLTEMSNRESMTQYSDYVCRQASSYDRNAKAADQPNWFANADTSQFIRQEKNNGRDEWVLLDAQGPGAIVRWWITAPHYKNNLYIYIDGSKEPVFSGNSGELIGGKALVNGSLSAERSRGRDLYLPLPYAKSIKVTCDQMPVQKNFYYQIVYRTYPKATKVESISKAVLAKCAGKISLVQSRQQASAQFSSEYKRRTDLISNKTEDNEIILNGPALIGELRFKVDAGDLPQALRSTLLSITFDGTETVLCPLGDFIGSGIGVNPFRSWYSKVEKDGTLVSWWPMPFEKNAKIQLIMPSEQMIKIERSVQWKPIYWTSETMYFHANWRQERQIETVAGQGTKDWNYLTVSGKGRYAGDVLTILNRSPAWWGEGDEKIYVDNEKFPSHFGTGTEDYYGYAWGSPLFFQAPFHAQPRVEGPQNFGLTTVFRTRALDSIPFEKNFKFDMEIWHWAKTKVDYAVTTFWYGLSGAKAMGVSHENILDESSRKVSYKTPFKGFVAEMELTSFPKSGTVSEQGMTSFKRQGHAWKNNRQLWWTGGKAGDVLTLTVKNKKASAKKLTLGLTKAVDYGKFEISLDGVCVAKSVDLFIPKNVERSELVLTISATAPGDHKLVIKLLGKNEKSVGTMFGIDSATFE